MTEAEMRHEGRGFRWSWQKHMTDEEVAAEEMAWEKRYEWEKRERERAYQSRGGQPPRYSKVGGPPADWMRWNDCLEGIPVANATEANVDEGWVLVFPIKRERQENGKSIRVIDQPQRRLCGAVTMVTCGEWTALAKERGVVEVYEDEERGEPIPGTDAKTLSKLREAEWKARHPDRAEP